MRISIIGSCGKKKAIQSKIQPTCSDLASLDDHKYWQEKLKNQRCIARDMYKGNQNVQLKKGLDILREIDEVEIEFHIVSAGFGLVHENELIPPYECSFSSMSRKEIVSRAHRLRIPHDFVKVCQKGFDWMYLALGKNYLMALGEHWPRYIQWPVVLFNDSYTFQNAITLPSGNNTVRQFSNRGFKIHGAAGFKGDLLRLLAEYVTSKDDPYSEVLNWSKAIYFKELVCDLGGI